MSLKIEDTVYSSQANLNIINSVPEESKLILDIGCGDGANARLLEAKKMIIDGITHSQEEAKLAQQYCRTIFIYNLEKGLPPDIIHKYDVIICSHVLEHIANPQQLLNDIKNFLKKDGILIIALPNIMHYRYRLKILFGKFDYEKFGVMDNTHLKWYTFVSAQKLLIENSFNIEKAWVEGGIPFQRYLNFLPSKMKKYIKYTLYSISKGFFGGEILIVSTAYKSSNNF